MIWLATLFSLIILVLGPAWFYIGMKVGPNPFIGFMMGFAYASDEVWDKTNLYALKRSFETGLIMTITALILPQHMIAYITMLGIFFIAAVGNMGIRTIQYSSELAEREGFSSAPKGEIKPIEPIEVTSVYKMVPILLFLLFVAFTSINYNQLPDKMAVSFTRAGIPDYSMGKQDAIALTLGLSLYLLSATFLFYYIGRNYPIIFHGGAMNLEPDVMIRFVGIWLSTVQLMAILAQYDTIMYNISNGNHPIKFTYLMFFLAILFIKPTLWLLYVMKEVHQKHLKEHRGEGIIEAHKHLLFKKKKED